MSLRDDQIDRYARHLLLKEVGGQGQQKLLDARVLVVGAGGLGAPIIQYLAAAGVGTLGVADNDAVALSNLQRQILYRTDDVGAAKIDKAQEVVVKLNPDVEFIPHKEKIDKTNADAIIKDYDLIVEGVDTFDARYILNSAAIKAQKPLLSAAVGRFDGQLALFKPFQDPGRLPCYRCFTPEPPPLDAQVNCAEEGVIGALTGVIGTLAAMEALKEIIGLGDTLAGSILLYDGLGGRMRRVTLPADPECADCGVLHHAKTTGETS